MNFDIRARKGDIENDACEQVSRFSRVQIKIIADDEFRNSGNEA